MVAGNGCRFHGAIIVPERVELRSFSLHLQKPGMSIFLMMLQYVEAFSMSVRKGLLLTFCVKGPSHHVFLTISFTSLVVAVVSDMTFDRLFAHLLWY